MEGWKMCFNLPQGRLDMPMRSWMIWGCGFSNEDNNWRTQPHSSKPIYNHNHIFQRQCKLNTYYGRMARYKQWYIFSWYTWDNTNLYQSILLQLDPILTLYQQTPMVCIYLLRKVVCLFCLSHWHLTNHGAPSCAIGTLGKPLLSRVVWR
jgi:hypothetical protein